MSAIIGVTNPKSILRKTPEAPQEPAAKLAAKTTKAKTTKATDKK